MWRLITAPNKAAVTHVLRSPKGIERVTIRENLMALVMFSLTGCGTQEEVNDGWVVKHDQHQFFVLKHAMHRPVLALFCMNRVVIEYVLTPLKHSISSESKW